LADGLSKAGDTFVDGAVIAAARTLPSWSDGDVPPIPSVEREAVKELQNECQKMLAGFVTTSKQDQKLLGKYDVCSLVLESRYTELIVIICVMQYDCFLRIYISIYHPEIGVQKPVKFSSISVMHAGLKMFWSVFWLTWSQSINIAKTSYNSTWLQLYLLHKLHQVYGHLDQSNIH